MKKESLTILLALLMSMVASVASAYTYNAQINGIYYNLDSEEGTAEGTAVVTSNPNKYSGDITIPASFEYDGTIYSVTSIGMSAFSDCTGLTTITMVMNIDSNDYE